MTRVQRQLHARMFYVLAPLLAALFVYALVTREHATRALREPSHAIQEEP